MAHVAHRICGGWSPITDVTYPKVVAVGKFAVDEHNKRLLGHVPLKFVKVVEGEQQVVSGVNYKLMITVADGSSHKTYVAVVWDQPWKKLRRLTSFRGPV